MTRTNCYWYHEYRDMNMTVPYCEELRIDNPHCENECSCKYYISKDDADNIIRNASAEPKWIPCSERLPSAEDCPMDCMVTRRSKYVGNYTDMAVAEADGTWTHEDWKAIAIKGEATCISTRDADIIAWMPLPKPYGESEVEE